MRSTKRRKPPSARSSASSCAGSSKNRSSPQRLRRFPSPTRTQRHGSHHVVWREDLKLSSDETTAAGELWHVVRHMAEQEDEQDASFQIVSKYLLGTGLPTSDHNRAFLEIFVDPILTWLKERILKDDLLLHSLERYAREAAWFRRDELRARYQGDTQRGEAILDEDLRHHLLRDGIDFPFSQVHGPSGRPDIVAPDADAEPLPLEVKVYDPSSSSKDDKWVRSGFVQAIEYAHDYRRADGYLVVFDTSTEGLSVDGEDATAHLPVVRESGVSVFIVVVPIGETQTASSRKTVKRKTLTPDFLRAA
jgi:hypothetical protein